MKLNHLALIHHVAGTPILDKFFPIQADRYSPEIEQADDDHARSNNKWSSD